MLFGSMQIEYIYGLIFDKDQEMGRAQVSTPPIDRFPLSKFSLIQA